MSTPDRYSVPHVRSIVAAIMPFDDRELGEELGVIATPLVDEPIFLTRTRTVGLDGGHVDVSLWHAFRGTVGMTVSPDPNEFIDHRWFSFPDITPAGRFDPELPRFLAKLESTL